MSGLTGAPDSASIRADLGSAWAAITRYEQALSREMLHVLQDCGARVYGVADPAHVAERVPTFSFTMPGLAPREVTDAAIRADLGIRDGHLYAPRLMRRLKVPVETGVVRVSLVHYNTMAEIHRLGEVLRGLKRAR
jgi:selenocysteine lyase/cysteine desulfurase